MDSDERLYERMRAGESAAFDLLYARYERRLFAFIRAFVGDGAEAEDVLHETFLSVFRGSATAFAGASFRAWVYQIARNASLNRLRSRARGARVLDRVASEPMRASESAAAAFDQKEVVQALAGAVAQLPSALAQVYQLRASGLSYDEMATVLGVPLGTVKSRMHELVKKLKEEMRPWTAN
jgi:RNA polymerase sigma-70 factor (ECF subfamily)